MNPVSVVGNRPVEQLDGAFPQRWAVRPAWWFVAPLVVAVDRVQGLVSVTSMSCSAIIASTAWDTHVDGHPVSHTGRSIAFSSLLGAPPRESDRR